MKNHVRRALIGLLLLPACLASSRAVCMQLTAKDVGLTLLALAPEDLDAIQGASGYRVGVVVIKVEENSPAARAGIRKGDVILAIGSKGVDTPKAADDALAGKSGALPVAILRPTEGAGGSALQLTLTLPAATLDTGRKDSTPETGARASTDSASIQARLKALEDARRAGVLNEDEYLKKKAELNESLRQARQPAVAADPQKLKALDDAHKAGVLSDEEYAKKRNELLGIKAVPDTRPAAGEPLIPAIKGKIFRHPIGFEFVQPADWIINEQGDMLVLTPPNQAKSAQGPLELYAITGERVDTEGIRQPDDPRVATFLDQQVKQLLPALNRSGPPGSIDTSAGKAVVLDWLAKNSQGQEVLARCYVNIIKGYGVALTGIGMKEKIEARDGTLRRMFVTFGMREGTQDPALVGRWSLTGTYSLTNWSVYEDSWSRAQMATDSSTTLALAGNGTWSRVYESQTMAGAGGIWLESSNRKESKGRWYAGDGLLYLVTDDDLWETYKYKLEQTGAGRQLRLASEKAGTTWQEAR